MLQSFKITATIAATPKQIYKAWLDGKEHAAFTGEAAESDPRVGGHFTAFGDYIKGTNLELVPNKKIVQAWRTTEFSDGHGDSRLEITLEKVNGGTKVTLNHTGIPDGRGESYKDGWKKFYFRPLKKYFERKK